MNIRSDPFTSAMGMIVLDTTAMAMIARDTLAIVSATNITITMATAACVKSAINPSRA